MAVFFLLSNINETTHGEANLIKVSQLAYKTFLRLKKCPTHFRSKWHIFSNQGLVEFFWHSLNLSLLQVGALVGILALLILSVGWFHGNDKSLNLLF